MGSLGVNVPALIVVGISIVIGLLMVVVFGYTSDQKAIHVAKDHLKAHLLALRLFQDQIGVVIRSYGRIFCGEPFLYPAFRLSSKKTDKPIPGIPFVVLQTPKEE